MIRLWAGWFTAALAAARAGQRHRPLLIVLDCKGGRDARVKADRTRRLLYGAGARRVAIWPDEARLSLWDLPPQDLAVLLYQMIDTGTGAAAYYADIMQAVLTLAVTAPCGPPLNAAGFLDRLDARWLQHRLGSRAATPRRRPGSGRRPGSLPDIQLRYATLLGRLGPALDGPGTLADADAWYFILEGTREPSVAEAQAMALTELAAHAATRPATPSPGRCCWPPMTTPRSPAGCRCRTCTSAAGPWASACRSPPSPGRAWARARTSGTGSRPPPTAASGSCTPPTPSRWSPLAGTRRVLETAHKLIGGVWGDEGTTREQQRLDRRPRPHPPPGGRAGLLHPARRRHLRPGRPAQAVPAHPAAPARRRRARRPGCPSPATNPRPGRLAGPRPASMTSSDPEPAR